MSPALRPMGLGLPREVVGDAVAALALDHHQAGRDRLLLQGAEEHGLGDGFVVLWREGLAGGRIEARLRLGGGLRLRACGLGRSNRGRGLRGSRLWSGGRLHGGGRLHRRLRRGGLGLRHRGGCRRGGRVDRRGREHGAAPSARLGAYEVELAADVAGEADFHDPGILALAALVVNAGRHHDRSIDQRRQAQRGALCLRLAVPIRAAAGAPSLPHWPSVPLVFPPRWSPGPAAVARRRVPASRPAAAGSRAPHGP